MGDVVGINGGIKPHQIQVGHKDGVVVINVFGGPFGDMHLIHDVESARLIAANIFQMCDEIEFHARAAVAQAADDTGPSAAVDLDDAAREDGA